MPPINSETFDQSSERLSYVRNDDDDDSTERNRNRKKGSDDDDNHNGDDNDHNRSSSDDEENSSTNGGFGGGGFGFGFGGGGGSGGGNGSNSGTGNRVSSSFTTTSTEIRSSTIENTPTDTVSVSSTTATVVITRDSFTSPFLPTSTTSSLTPIPTSPPDNAIGTPSSSNVAQGTNHGLSLGSIVAIILGILFCITISGVIFVITRPKFGSLARLWRNSNGPRNQFPSSQEFFEPKQQRSSSNLYRRYNPSPRPFSRTFFDLQAFRFGSPGNPIGQNAAMPNPSRNLVTSNVAPPIKYDDLQIHQIYSTHMAPPSAVIKSNVARSISSKSSKQQTFSSLSSRMMSMIDTFSDSGVGSGRGSFQTYDWKPPRHDPASELRKA